MADWDGTLLIPSHRAMHVAHGQSHPFARIGGHDAYGRGRGAVFQDRQVQEIGHVFGGRAARPFQPIILVAPDGKTPICLVTDGQTEASELEEIAAAAMERGAENLKKHGAHIRFDEWRERHHLPRREDVPDLYLQALRDYVTRNRANWRSAPKPRQDKYAKGGAMTTVPAKTWQEKPSGSN